MKKIKLVLAVLLIASFSLVQTGCIGSFTLTKKVIDFNRDLGNKFVEEAVFIAFLIIPVYEVATLIDAIVLNLIEFWTGDNLLSYTNEKGENIDIIRENNLYTIHNKSTGESQSIYYDEMNNTVMAEINGEITKLVEIDVKTNAALVYLPGSKTQTIDLTNKTTVDIRNEVINNLYLALK